MADNNSGDTKLSFGISGKIGFPAGCGIAVCGQARCAGEYKTSGIWQMRKTKTGKRPIKMKFYAPKNPQTPAQQANRAKFALAVSTWSALTDEEKSAYTVRAKRRNMFGWGLFIREYYQSN